MRRVLFALIVVAVSVLAITTASATSFLEEEAGICAYTNAGRAIDLEKLKSAYRTIEHEMDDYVIGSVSIPGYAETEDVHVYVHKDGWIAAYYFGNEPVSKIVDWESYQGGTITGTKLELALVQISNTANFPLVDVKYYDFSAPEANKLLIVADGEYTRGGTDSFNITIPLDITVYERTWSLFGSNSAPQLYIDDLSISSFNADDKRIYRYGDLTPNQLKQGTGHTVKVHNGDKGSGGWSAGAIVLVYQQP